MSATRTNEGLVMLQRKKRLVLSCAVWPRVSLWVFSGHPPKLECAY